MVRESARGEPPRPTLPPGPYELGCPPVRRPDLNHQWPAEDPHSARPVLGSPRYLARRSAAPRRPRHGPHRGRAAAGSIAPRAGRSHAAPGRRDTLAARAAEYTSRGGRSSHSSRQLPLAPRDYPQGGGPRLRRSAAAKAGVRDSDSVARSLAPLAGRKPRLGARIRPSRGGGPGFYRTAQRPLPPDPCQSLTSPVAFGS